MLCTGDKASLVSVTAASGWPIDIRNTGPQEVEVRFGDDGDEITVKARCSSGRRRLDAERRSDPHATVDPAARCPWRRGCGALAG